VARYRELLAEYLRQPAEEAPPFFRSSFEADPFATAETLLERRDELLLAGWDFVRTEGMPSRLLDFARLESMNRADGSAPEKAAGRSEAQALGGGFADRFRAVEAALDRHRLPFGQVLLNEPPELLPVHWRRLFERMTRQGIPLSRLHPSDPYTSEAQSDLERFRHYLFRKETTGETSRAPLSADGSLVLIRANRADEAALWFSQLFRLNNYVPAPSGTCLLLADQASILDIALAQEGLPALGTTSASLSRPALQLLRLVSAFLWQPTDIHKVLEFVSLPIKPLPEELAHRIAQQIAEVPGLHGDRWQRTIQQYFSDLETGQVRDRSVSPDLARRQYRFWFERPRYPLDGQAPKQDVKDIFLHLQEWALSASEEGGHHAGSLLTLSTLAGRIAELLTALPETSLRPLELDRIIRTQYEAVPVTFQDPEAGHIPYVTHPAAFAEPVREMWWWNFLLTDPPHFFSRWYRPERDYLAANDVHLDTPAGENARQTWQQSLPIRLAQERLVLFLPENSMGESATPHPLMGNLEAAFGDLTPVTLPVDILAPNLSATGFLSRHFELPCNTSLSGRPLPAPKPFLHLRSTFRNPRLQESVTSLETLLYYPHLWFFRHILQWRQPPLLSVIADKTLQGNLSHRIFEQLLSGDIQDLDKPGLARWVEAELARRLPQEGAILLQYGREPDRIRLANRIKTAAWNLLRHLRRNGWRVRGTEHPLHGQIPLPPDLAPTTTPDLTGIADLVLERDSGETAILDLKWRGISYRRDLLKNRRDLQLACYAHMLASSDESWPYTGYFIIQNGEMLVRNKDAFRDANPVVQAEEKDEAVARELLSKIGRTWAWRNQQLAAGRIEIRSRRTAQAIEQAYTDSGESGKLLDLLEMEGKDSPFDEFRYLLNSSA
jgi:RecB family exonuclease